MCNSYLQVISLNLRFKLLDSDFIDGEDREWNCYRL